MTWPAIDRYGVAAAPDGLALVQDLLDTVSTGRKRQPDLLADAGTASVWAGQAMRAWAEAAGRPVEPVVIGHADVEALRVLRTDLRTGIDGHAQGHPPSPTLRSVTLGAELHQDGRVLLTPRGEGWRRIAGAALIEVAAAQKVGEWTRLKVCHNERCAVAFYDRSRNNSGVWHDVRVCGNAVNLRASRARRKARSESGQAG